MGPKGAKISFKKALWPHKLVQGSYFRLEGAERGWITNEDIQADQFDPFATPRMLQMWPYGHQKGDTKGSK